MALYSSLNACVIALEVELHTPDVEDDKSALGNEVAFVDVILRGLVLQACSSLVNARRSNKERVMHQSGQRDATSGSPEPSHEYKAWIRSR